MQKCHGTAGAAYHCLPSLLPLLLQQLQQLLLHYQAHRRETHELLTLQILSMQHDRDTRLAYMRRYCVRSVTPAWFLGCRCWLCRRLLCTVAILLPALSMKLG